jgi:hypothetical protein
MSNGLREPVQDSMPKMFHELLRDHRSHNIRLVSMAEGSHAYPSRTRPLSPPAPMVLGPQGPGRVGRRQAGAIAPNESVILRDQWNWLFSTEKVDLD